MKLFIKKIFILFIILNSFIIFIYFSELYIKIIKPIPINKNTNILFAGDSHIVYGINDSLVKNSKNIALAGEPLSFTYFKIKYSITKSTTKIKKIYLGISYHNFSSNIDDLSSGEFLNRDISSGYYIYLPLKEKIEMLYNHKSHLLVFLSSLYVNSLKTVMNVKKYNEIDYAFWGKYSNNFNNIAADTISIKKRVDFLYFKNGKIRNISIKQKFYLNEIKKLCKSENIELVLLNTPLNKFYKTLVPKKFKNEFYSIINKENLIVLDFKDLKLSDSLFIPDGDHLSEKGAIIISNFINNKQ